MSPKLKLIILTLSQAIIAFISFGIYFSIISWSAIQPIEDAAKYNKTFPADWEYFSVGHGKFTKREGPTISERPLTLAFLIFIIAASLICLFITGIYSKRLQAQVKSSLENPRVVDNVFKYTSLVIVAATTLAVIVLSIISLV